MNNEQGEANTSPPKPDAESCCWICLSEDADDTGKLPVRDCSCRNSSGWAHFSCLTRYARIKCEEAENAKAGNTSEAWATCPNCKQAYQKQLALDLADDLIEFAEERYSECTVLNRLRFVQALKVKLNATTAPKMTFDDLPISEGTDAANKILVAVKDMKDVLESEEEIVYPEDRLIFKEHMQEITSAHETYAYGKLMFLYSQDEGTEGNKEKSMHYCKILRDRHKTKGNEAGVRQMEAFMNTLNDDRVVSREDKKLLSFMRQSYEAQIQKKGENNAGAIDVAECLAVALFRDDRGVEAQRLVEKYVPISHRIHGSDHSQTKSIESLLSRLKERRVYIKGDIFEALRYQSGGDKCVVEGPLFVPRDALEQSVYTFDDLEMGQELMEGNFETSDLLLICGTPVICQGLQNATHLNGKLGDVRSFNEKKNRYVIHFEDESLKPALVKRGNVRIVFELPEVS